jgi:monovalent cation/hydrogen antiporter
MRSKGNPPAAGARGGVRGCGTTPESSVSDCAGAGGVGNQFRSAYSEGPAGSECCICGFSATVAVCVSVVDVVARVSPECGGDWIARCGAGGFHSVGGSGIFRSVYYGAGLEGWISAGGGGGDDGCDCATSIAKTIGLPRRIVDILEGESLLNDATGLLALEIGLAIMVRGQMPTVGGGLTRLAYLIAGGLVIGLLIGVAVGWLEKFIDDGPVELVVSLVVPYAVSLAGERAHASGVLAVVACGIYMSRKSVQFFSPATRLQVSGAWESLTFMLNGLLFVLIGLQLPYVLAGIHGRYGTRTLIFYGVLFSAVLIVLRMIWAFPAVKIASFAERRWLGHMDEEELKPREVFVVGWTGMRGVLALAAAISVPEVLWNGRPFEARNLIVFLAFCVIFVTLVLQGLTLPAVIRGLRLCGSTEMEPEEREARRLIIKAAIHYLEEGRKSRGTGAEHLYDDLMHRYRHKLALIGGGAEESAAVADREAYSRLRSIAEGALEAERRTLIGLRDGGGSVTISCGRWRGSLIWRRASISPWICVGVQNRLRKVLHSEQKRFTAIVSTKRYSGESIVYFTRSSFCTDWRCRSLSCARCSQRHLCSTGSRQSGSRVGWPGTDSADGLQQLVVFRM